MFGSSALQSSIRQFSSKAVVIRRSLTTTTYVHPLSQLVLQHLQGARADWIEEQGLDNGLTIRDDGTFVLEKPDCEYKIWTSYEPEMKQHWLILHKDDLLGQYMLQDNTKPAWNDANSPVEKIATAVDSMIDRINEKDEA